MGLDDQTGKFMRGFSKRTFDIVIAGAMIVLILPMYLLIAIAIVVTSPGPILYRASRIGMNGRSFKVFKFRTMIQDADKIGPALTVFNDPRITRVGKFLRHTKLDELPQLFNVIIGDMSLVGPRPEDPRFVNLYTPAQAAAIFSVRPGVTSPASIAFRDEERLLSGDNWETVYVQKILPFKLALDIDYINHTHVLLDVAILFNTVKALLSRDRIPKINAEIDGVSIDGT
jgi:lipopolysaccharide/colanic/teichoic acid biosynthesis glycosyltransferase